LGTDPHPDSVYTKNGPETDTHRLALSSLLQNLAPTTPPGKFVVLGTYDFLSDESKQDPVSSGIY
jgi:hypothetical protein